MQGLIVTKRGGVIPVHGWREADAVMLRWGILFARTGFELDEISGCNFFMYEECRSNPLPELTQAFQELQEVPCSDIRKDRFSDAPENLSAASHWTDAGEARR